MRSDTERQAARRARMRAQGFCLVHLWAHESDKAKVLAYAERLRKKRLKSPASPRT